MSNINFPLKLARCIRSGVIHEDSAAIVRAKSCLAASRQETVARKAARDLFARYNFVPFLP